MFLYFKTRGVRKKGRIQVPETRVRHYLFSEQLSVVAHGGWDTVSLRPTLNTNKHMSSSTSILFFGFSVFGFVEAGSQSVSQKGLEFTTFPRLTLWAILCLKFPSAGIAGMCHHSLLTSI